MKKHILILTIGLIALYSCENKEKEYLKNEAKVVNEKIMYDLSKIEKKYMANPTLAQPYFEFASYLNTAFDSILICIDNRNFREVHNRYIDLYSKLGSQIDMYYMEEIVNPCYFNKWIGNEKKYDFSDNKEILKLDVLNLENELINYLYNSIEADYFKFNRIQASVIDSSDNIKVGETYHANIFLAAFDTTQYPLIMVADISQPDSVLLMNQPDNRRRFEIDIIDGKGDYRRKVTRPGKHGYKGVIYYRAPNGKLISLPFQKEFQVREK